MNTSTHPVAPEEIMELLDGELPAGRQEFVSVHVGQCPECAGLANEFRSLTATLSNWNVSPIPGPLADAVLASTKKLQSGGKVPGAKFYVRAGLWNWKHWALGFSALASAVLLVAVCLGGFSNHAYTARHRTVPLAISPYFQKQKPVQETASPMMAVPQAKTKSTFSLPAPDSIAPVEVIASDSNGNLRGSGGGGGIGYGNAPKSFTVDGEPATDQQDQLASGPMIARTVSLTIVVKDFAVARATLDTILARHQGYAADLTVSTTEGAPRTLQASLRIPASQLAPALTELKALGRVENESQSGEEVTEQHADLVARLKNSRETEQRLQAILQQRTGKIRDVLEVEQEIARVRGEIEQMEAEQKALEHRVDYAAVNLSLSDVYQAQLNLPMSVGTRLRNSVVAGYHHAAETLIGVILFFAEYTPATVLWLLLLGCPAFLLWRRYRKALAAS
jgi:anti-sigma factor RsiW